MSLPKESFQKKDLPKNCDLIIPTEVRLTKERDALKVVFQCGEVIEYSAELLRVFSPSAEVKGHGSETPELPSGKAWVTIEDIEQIGNYAIRLTFSDGHNTGFYSWQYLYDLVFTKDELWNNYLKDLELAGKSR